MYIKFTSLINFLTIAILFFSSTAYSAGQETVKVPNLSITHNFGEDNYIKKSYSNQTLIIELFATIEGKNFEAEKNIINKIGKSQFIDSVKKIVLIIKGSTGGSIEHYLLLGKNLKEICQQSENCIFDIYIAGLCFSACTLLPFFADNRYALLSALVGLHTAITKSDTKILYYYTHIEMINQYTKLGANENWLTFNQDIFSKERHKNDTFISFDDMEKLGMVDSVQPSFLFNAACCGLNLSL